MVLFELLVTAALAILPFNVGIGIGIYSYRTRVPLLIIAGLPAVYFTVNFIVALENQGLTETLVIGIPLGISPVFIMLLTAFADGLFLGIGVGGWIRTFVESE